MLLIHPPVTRPCEPPAGIARLKAALASSGVRATVLDANLEGLLYMLQAPAQPGDTWTRRAESSSARHLADLRSGRAYRNQATYSRVVRDLNRLLEVFSAPFETKVSFSDYSSDNLQPVRTADLMRSAEQPEKNPFFSYYCARLPQLLEEQAPAWIGISVNYLSQALCAFALIGCLKQLAPGVRIALGGGLITSWLRRPDVRLDFTGLVDALIEGPGEEQVCRLAGVGHVPRIADLVPDYETTDIAGILRRAGLFPTALRRAVTGSSARFVLSAPRTISIVRCRSQQQCCICRSSAGNTGPHCCICWTMQSVRPCSRSLRARRLELRGTALPG